MNEASKTRKLWDESVLALMQGEGIDIGCGPDPILPHVERFDRAQGDANRVQDFVRRTYDFVFSSHTLEHMTDPAAALRGWFSLVRPGGHLILVVPDEDLYEQGAFPSLFNQDHKHTFTISKRSSWSPRSINLLDLLKTLDGEIVSLELQDAGIDRSLLKHDPRGLARLATYAANMLVHADKKGRLALRLVRPLSWLGAAIDQTALPGDRNAQIQAIVRKPDRG